MFLRGDGGCGSYGKAPPPAASLPDGSPDCVVTLTTLRQQALLYRLCGDFNPVHADPEIAKKAGFAEPILHGLCSMGMATRAVLEEFCGGNPDELRSLFVRFSSPVFPGDSIRYEFYRDATRVRFRARAAERDVIVLDRCEAELTSRRWGIAMPLVSQHDYLYPHVIPHNSRFPALRWRSFAVTSR